VGGQIDLITKIGVALFKKALSSAEIQKLMNKGIIGTLTVDSADKLSMTWGRMK
jgi:hypothetical protein